MANDWTATDYAAVSTAIDGGTYTADTAGWIDMLTRGPNPAPEPGSASAPVVFCIWALEFQEFMPDFSDSSRPIIHYSLVFEVHRQEKAGRCHVLTLEGEIRTQLKAVTGTGDVTYIWKSGQPVPIGKIGNYEVEQLNFETFGGAG